MCARLTPLLLVPLLSACTIGDLKQVKDDSDRRYEEAGRQLRDYRRPVYYQEYEGAWVGGARVALKERIPPELDRDIPFSVAHPVGLREIASALTTALDIPVILEPDIFVFDSPARETRATDSANSAIGLADAAGASRPLAALDTSQKKVTLRFHGKATRLLDKIVTMYGLNWVYQDRTIVISRLMTEVFRVAIIGGSTDVEATVGGSAAARSGTAATLDLASGNDTTAGGVNQSIVLKEEGIIFEDIASTVRNMLSPAGKLAASKSISTLTVTDTPATISAIRKYIRKENSHVTRQVHFNVAIVSVESKKNINYGLNLDFSYLASSLGLSFKTPALAAVAGAGNLSARVVERGNAFRNTQLMLQALNKLEGVNVVDEINTAALNYKNVPIQLTTSRGFIASSGSTVTSGGGAVISTSKAGNITTGLVMFAKPVIVDSFEDQMLLRLTLDLSQFLGFTTETVGAGSSAATRRLPNVDKRASIFERRVRSGETIVLSGFESLNNSTTESGLLAPDNWWLGGNRGARQQRKRILVLVTPTITGR